MDLGESSTARKRPDGDTWRGRGAASMVIVAGGADVRRAAGDTVRIWRCPRARSCTRQAQPRAGTGAQAGATPPVQRRHYAGSPRAAPAPHARRESARPASAVKEHKHSGNSRCAEILPLNFMQIARTRHTIPAATMPNAAVYGVKKKVNFFCQFVLHVGPTAGLVTMRR